jgi:hypothetical protein
MHAFDTWGKRHNNAHKQKEEVAREKTEEEKQELDKELRVLKQVHLAFCLQVALQ